MNILTGWRYYYRRYLGWLPVQFCMVCGKPYWGGFPEMEFYLGRLVNTWQAWMMDYCSTACCEKDMESEVGGGGGLDNPSRAQSRPNDQAEVRPSHPAGSASQVVGADELIGPGICDACGEEARELMVINHRGVAGLCACKECAGAGWPNDQAVPPRT